MRRHVDNLDSCSVHCLGKAGKIEAQASKKPSTCHGTLVAAVAGAADAFFRVCVVLPIFSIRGMTSEGLVRLMVFRQTGHCERFGSPGPARFSPAMRASMRQVWQKRWPEMRLVLIRLASCQPKHTTGCSGEVCWIVHADDAGKGIEGGGLLFGFRLRLDLVLALFLQRVLHGLLAVGQVHLVHGHRLGAVRLPVCAIFALLPLRRGAWGGGLSFPRGRRCVWGRSQVDISVWQTRRAGDGRHGVAVEGEQRRRRAIGKGRVAAVVELGGVEDVVEEGDEGAGGLGGVGVGPLEPGRPLSRRGLEDGQQRVEDGPVVVRPRRRARQRKVGLGGGCRGVGVVDGRGHGGGR